MPIMQHGPDDNDINPYLTPCPADYPPCPLCGEHPDMLESGHIVCCNILVDNADAWFLLPRRPDYNGVDCAGCPERRRSALTWTTEPPTVAHVGRWFWSEIPGQSMPVPVIVAELDGVLGIGRGTSEQGLTMETCRAFGVKFAGPIPTPHEPGES